MHAGCSYMDSRRDTAVWLSSWENMIPCLIAFFVVENVLIIVFLTLFQLSTPNCSSLDSFIMGIIFICFSFTALSIIFQLEILPYIMKWERKAGRKQEKKIVKSEEKYDNLQEKTADDGDKANTNSSPAYQISLAEHEAILNEMITKREEDAKIAIDSCKEDPKEIMKESKHHEERAQQKEPEFIFRAGINNSLPKKTTNIGENFNTPTIQIPLDEHRSLMNEMRTKCEKDIKRAVDKCKKELKEKAKEKMSKYHEEKAKWENERYSFGHEIGRLQHFENIVRSYTPAWNKPYATYPYATNPYVTNPYATNPYATYPYGTYPYHTYPYGTAYGTSQNSTSRNATKKTGADKTGAAKNDTKQSGTNQSGTSGTTPNLYGALNSTKPNEINQFATTTRRDVLAGSKLPVPNPKGDAFVGQTMTAPELATTLAKVPIEQQQRLLGINLYPLVHQIEPEHAPKVTGMLLEMDEAEVLYLLETPDALKAKVAEAMEILKN